MLAKINLLKPYGKVATQCYGPNKAVTGRERIWSCRSYFLHRCGSLAGL